MLDAIRIHGARTHNLKNVSVDIPRNKMVVITGVSGSGKSSLAFDTLYAEGQRRYAESVSSYARQFMGVLDRPDVDSIEGISPSIAIRQHLSSGGARSTVGTLTEISDYVRVLFARAGTPCCPVHGIALTRSGVHDMVDAALSLPEGSRLMILAPLAARSPGAIAEAAQEMLRRGFGRIRVDAQVYQIEELPEFGQGDHVCELVVDRLKVQESARTRLAESFDTAVKITDGVVMFVDMENGLSRRFNTRYACSECDYTTGDFSPAQFSFNSPLGACPECQGLGTVERFDETLLVSKPDTSLREGAVFGWSEKQRDNFFALQQYFLSIGQSVDAVWTQLPQSVQKAVLYGDAEHHFTGVIGQLNARWKRARTEGSKMGMRQLRSVGACPCCGGSRFRQDVHHVYLGQGESRINVAQFNALSLEALKARLETLVLSDREQQIAQEPIAEILKRLSFLIDMGLGYLTLERSAATLSGGEEQRLRLAGQIASGLTGVLYVLDEPTIGLHQYDTQKLIAMVRRLVEGGNTVVLVEHDSDVMRAADYLIDMGPGAGEQGGCLVAKGTPQELMCNENSRTGAYLSGRRRIELTRQEMADPLYGALTIEGASGHNLKNITVHFPFGSMTAVTGVSGSGKSSLVDDTIYAAAMRQLHNSSLIPLPYREMRGLDRFSRVIKVDQSPIGKTPRSNTATYTGLHALIREVFAKSTAAMERGYDAARFSFNVPGGRCEACQGDGEVKFEMGFLPAVYVVCSTCQGLRYNRETLEVKYRGKSIADVMDMTVSEALVFFENWPLIARKLQTLSDVGLGYIRLGQSATTFSGGEAQRIKLAEELSKQSSGNTLYILDEPTTGLHFDDVAMLVKLLRRLCDLGNTVIAVEHNLDVVRLSDWVVDIGPGGGVKGGSLVIEGTPAQVAQCGTSLTGHFLDMEMRQSLKRGKQ